MPTSKNIERQMISVGYSISKKNSTSGFTRPQILSSRLLTTLWLKFSNPLFKMKCQIFGIDSFLNFINLKPHNEYRRFRNAEIVFFISSRLLRSRFSTNDRLWYVGLWCVGLWSSEVKRLLKNRLEMKNTISAFRNLRHSFCGFKLMKLSNEPIPEMWPFILNKKFWIQFSIAKANRENLVK